MTTLTASWNYASLICVALLTYTVSGCGGGAPEAEPEGEHADDEDHEHAATGPHGGDLIELGDEAYHAELVHDEAAGSVAIYLLDSSAKKPVPIAAADLTINLTHEGRGEQFKMAASPETTDPEGKTSRFQSSDAELVADLDQEGHEAQLVVVIEGQQYRGVIEHAHAGEDEDHKD